MNYDHLSREELIQKIEMLERLNGELLDEKEQETTLDFPWTGNLGHWYWDIKSNVVTFNPLKITALGYERHEIPNTVTYQFFTDRLHPDDYKITMDAMSNHLSGKINVYEVEYRIKAKDGKYKWYYDRGRVTQYNQQGRPVFVAGIVFDITDKKELQLELECKNEMLSEMSYTDELTKIGNRRGINDYLEFYVSQAIRKKINLSIAIFDIDNFKNINDTRGHLYGDKVLVDIVSIIRKNIRHTDFLGRFGGEEFIVIFPNTDLIAAKNLAEEIREHVQAYHFADGLEITISGGVKQYAGEDITKFIDLADANLYRAKKRGKNQIVTK